jgi:hypothetical protein
VRVRAGVTGDLDGDDADTDGIFVAAFDWSFADNNTELGCVGARRAAKRWEGSKAHQTLKGVVIITLTSPPPHQFFFLPPALRIPQQSLSLLLVKLLVKLLYMCHL